jgi:glucose dehydrogenase
MITLSIPELEKVNMVWVTYEVCYNWWETTARAELKIQQERN